MTNLEVYLSEPGAPLLAPSVTLTMFLCLFVGNFIGGLALVLISAVYIGRNTKQADNGA
jgi:hypothetical protein